LRILRIVGNGQDAVQRAVEKRRLRRPEGKDRKRDARRGQRRIVQPHLVATIVERPVAGRLCGEDRVVYAHASLPSGAFVADHSQGNYRTNYRKSVILVTAQAQRRN
jgi:hypothetical protein